MQCNTSVFQCLGVRVRQGPTDQSYTQGNGVPSSVAFGHRCLLNVSFIPTSKLEVSPCRERKPNAKNRSSSFTYRQLLHF